MFRQPTTARFVGLSRCRLFLLGLGVEARAQSSPAKGQTSKLLRLSRLSLSVCQLHYKPIEQNNSRRLALPTVSLTESLLVLSSTLVSCTATLLSVYTCHHTTSRCWSLGAGEGLYENVVRVSSFVAGTLSGEGVAWCCS